jgi:hypothetical protein
MGLRVTEHVYDPITQDPSSPEDGSEWYRSDTGQFRRKVGAKTQISANMEDIFCRFFVFGADQLLSPNNSDWTVNALAPLAADSNDAGLPVRLFDDTTEEGVGFQTTVPPNTTNLIIKMISRAETAPAGARTVGVKLYNRGVPDDSAVESWSSGTALNDVDIPANENWQYDEQTISLSSLGITAGEFTQFELTRVNPSAGTELTGDWALLRIALEFA